MTPRTASAPRSILLSVLFLFALFVGAAFATAVDNYVWIANQGDSTVSRIDTTTNTVTATIAGVGTYPYGLAVDEDSVWVANT